MTDERYMRPGVEFALAKLSEECGELVSAIGKSMRWGLGSRNPEPGASRESNEDWIFREMADVEDAIRRFRVEVGKTTPAERYRMFNYSNPPPTPSESPSTSAIKGER